MYRQAGLLIEAGDTFCQNIIWKNYEMNFYRTGAGHAAHKIVFLCAPPKARNNMTKAKLI